MRFVKRRMFWSSINERDEPIMLVAVPFYVESYCGLDGTSRAMLRGGRQMKKLLIPWLRVNIVAIVLLLSHWVLPGMHITIIGAFLVATALSIIDVFVPVAERKKRKRKLSQA